METDPSTGNNGETDVGKDNNRSLTSGISKTVMPSPPSTTPEVTNRKDVELETGGKESMAMETDPSTVNNGETDVGKDKNRSLTSGISKTVMPSPPSTTPAVTNRKDVELETGGKESMAMETDPSTVNNGE